MEKNLLIKTRHFRYVWQPILQKQLTVEPTSDYEQVLMSMNEIREKNIDRKLILSNGGKTQVAIYDGENKLAEAEAVCGYRDNYNRRLGRQIAINRAYKQGGIVT